MIGPSFGRTISITEPFTEISVVSTLLWPNSAKSYGGPHGVRPVEGDAIAPARNKCEARLKSYFGFTSEATSVKCSTNGGCAKKGDMCPPHSA